MVLEETIFILGCGAIGLPLAAYLVKAGKTVVAVRTSTKDVRKSMVTVTVENGANRMSAPVGIVSLSKLSNLEGTIVIAAKSYANEAIAMDLKGKTTRGPLVIMQNGVGVEKPFLDGYFSAVYRCVLYVTSQARSEYDFAFRPITSSPIGIIIGEESGLEKCVEDLTTDGFSFRSERNIQREIWKKAIINSVFNSICPLLDADNGVFARDEEIANLARDVVRECVTLTDRLHTGLSESELMDQIMLISKGSDGQLISTLQDIRIGRQTEMEFLNLEIARVAASMKPRLDLPKTELLGRMILAKSLQRRRKER
ncbi:MAG TPA: ketopantoate reductase C-terminal domain-containing protein [Candidatus Eisenbacteria bacterium]|nr:ketopantoate reductase C-terminal domain-containing protein [Candidatus Eisenbacteria bacterium]